MNLTLKDKLIVKTDIQNSETADRKPKQERSQETLSKITLAAVDMLAEHGTSGITHRKIAKHAGVSLSATTYYFSSKSDILVAASRSILNNNIEYTASVAQKKGVGSGAELDFADFVVGFVRNIPMKQRSRARAMAWAEISLDAVRHEESLIQSQESDQKALKIWIEIAASSNIKSYQNLGRSGLDLTIGLVFMTLGLALTEKQINQVLKNGEEPLEIWKTDTYLEGEHVGVPSRDGKKAKITKEKIINSAIKLLISDGPAAVTYRRIARDAGLTSAAPSYYFKNIDSLLHAAQSRLFASSKQRYRTAMTGVNYPTLDINKLTNLATVVFQREATENQAHNLATYAIWLQAARRPELRPIVWNAISDQCDAWFRSLAPISASPRPIDGLLMQALFVGKLLRIMSTGVSNEDLAAIRIDLTYDFEKISKNEFWI